MIRIRQYISVSAHRLLMMVLACVLFSASTSAQTAAKEDLEEIGVVLNVQRIGSTEINAFVQAQSVYLSVAEVFEFLKIKNSLSADTDSLTGFFINPDNPYVISKKKNAIAFQGKIIRLPAKDLIQTETGLYLKCNHFAVFGLDCGFDFRSLMVTLQTKVELPVMKELQQELTRRNISRLKGERKADTTIGRRFPLLRIGMADWSLNANQTASGTVDSRISLSLGAVVLGGEANVNLNISPGRPVDERMQSYRWRYVNNENSLLRQLSVGKLSPESISTMSTGINGFQLSNTPTTYRKSFGTYIISDKTEPEWMVELYVNNILVNYTKADASGFFMFEVPMVYGASSVKLRFYGPWGEEKTREESIVIPFNFLPERQLEYTLTGGVVTGNSRNRFARLNVKYGLGSFITVGGGMEYYTAVTSGKYMPYATAALRLFSKIILYGEHTMGVRTKGILNYRHHSNLQVDINYTRYNPEQKAVKGREDRRAVISMPFRGKKVSVFSRLTLSQTNDVEAKTNAAELLVSSFFSGISSNITTYALLNQPQNPLVRSTLSLTFRLPKQIRFTQQVQYEYKERNFSMLRTEMEKPMFRTAFLNLAYERNAIAATNNVSVGLRFNLSGLQASVFALRSKETTIISQALRGSLLYDDNNSRLLFSNQGTVGRGALSIVPFLDLNGNGKRDRDEQKVCGLKIRVNGGRIAYCNKDTTIQVTGLEAYANYLLELDKNSFDNVAWQIKKPLINVVADPNYFKTVEVPVAVVGEVEGKVLLLGNEGQKGLGRMMVRFFQNGKLVAKVMSEADGYFNYMGLLPGEYTAEIDREQLKNLQFVSVPEKLAFTIKADKEGDLLRDLKFVLKKEE